jgi:molybdopterin-guanine dinucleotide biosynthesis protein A
MTTVPNVDGFILAGGQSSRMGQDKALLELGGVPMLLRTWRLVKPLVTRLTVVGPPDRYSRFGFAVVSDDQPGLGPLGGIATALRLTTTSWFLLVGCDLPFLSRDWLRFLIERGIASEAGAVIPISARGPEPLCAMFNERLAGPVAQSLALGVRKVTDGFRDMTIELIRESESKPFDPDDNLFNNMNSPEDYAAARAFFEGRQG